ncbi:MAG: phytanoyl-CoA dioxygenase family protein [Pseudohongiellaceae bacterium]
MARLANKRSNDSALPLTDAEIQNFNANGFLIKDFGFDEQLLDLIIQEIYPLYGQGYRDNPTTPERYLNAWRELDSVKSLAAAPQVLAALEQLWGRKALAFQTLNFPIGTSQKPHSDSIHFNTEPPGFMAGVWVALEDIDQSNGPLVYYPGSHKLDVLNMADLNLEAGREHYPEYEQEITKVIEARKLTPELGLVKKGDAIIWHANLLHGGHPHEDPARSRHSQVTHYFFEDCRYYTPMLYGKNDVINYDKPEWINQAPPSFSQRVKNKIRRTLKR